MIFINALRMIVDLSFYFFFAEFAVSSFGGKSMLIEMLLLSICYGILILIQKYTKNRIFLLLPVLLLFLPSSMGLTIANRVALLLPVIYILYLILKEEYGLSWDRQVDIFSASWKTFLIAGICLCLAGKYQQFLTCSVPMAFISLTGSVLLMRMLRHEPEIYLSRQYQLRNLFLFVGILAVAWLLSRPFVLNSIWNAFTFLYMQCIVPIFSFFITCFITILQVLGKLFSWIKLNDLELEGNEVGVNVGINPFSDLEQEITGGGRILESFFMGIVILLLIAAAFLFFRWLASSGGTTQKRLYGIDIVRSPEQDTRRKSSDASTVLQIRRQYRKFLKLYTARGEQISSASTSEDIARRGSELFAPDVMEEMRSIYIRARYNNQASRADLKRIKQINQMLKQ